MTEPKKQVTEPPPPRRRDRDSAQDRPQKRRDYVAGANGDQDVDASEADTAEDQRRENPEKDGTGW